MRSLHIHGPDDCRIDEIADPAPGSGDVVLKIDACGVCGSDLGYIAQGMLRAGGDPLPLGHEAAGTVVEIGDAVTSFAIGDRVLINPMTHRDNVIGNGGTEGAFAERLLIREPVPGKQLIPVPPAVTAERAAIAEPLAVALHAIHRAELEPGERAVVLGAGPIGLGAVYWLSWLGHTAITVVDRSNERLERARLLGADHVINTLETDLANGLFACHGHGTPLFGRPTAGTDVFFDMAGANPLLDQVIGLGKSRARIVLTALYKGTVQIDFRAFLLREMSIVSATGYVDEMAETLAMLATAGSELDPYISARFDFADIQGAINAARDPASGKVMVLFR